MKQAVQSGFGRHQIRGRRYQTWSGIEQIEYAEDKEEAIFDLSGRRLQRIPEKGLYIQNGKKMVK